MAFENNVYDKAIDERRSAVERRPYRAPSRTTTKTRSFDRRRGCERKGKRKVSLTHFGIFLSALERERVNSSPIPFLFHFLSYGSFVLRYVDGRKARAPVEVVPDSVQLLFCDAYKVWEFVRPEGPGAGEPSFTLS